MITGTVVDTLLVPLVKLTFAIYVPGVIGNVMLTCAVPLVTLTV